MAKIGNHNAQDGALKKKNRRIVPPWIRDFTFGQWQKINWLVADALASRSDVDHKKLVVAVELALKEAWGKGYKYGKAN